MERLFVYGSLGPGRPNEHVLKKIEGSWERGFVKGRLYNEGWGADIGFPGIRIEEKIEIIEGYVFCSEHLEKYWEELDNFEGPAYERIKTTISLERGKKEVQAFIYALK